jgi:hypothetical protein
VARETHVATILASKTKRLRKETGNPGLVSKYHKTRPRKVQFLEAVVRPYKVMLLSPAVATMTLYCAIVYGILYLLYTTISYAFVEVYQFSPIDVGLAYLALGIGLLLGLIILGASSDRIMNYLARKNRGETKPEYRLMPLLLTNWTMPAGLLIYGWTLQHSEQWALPLFGTLLVGFSMIPANVCVAVCFNILQFFRIQHQYL